MSWETPAPRFADLIHAPPPPRLTPAPPTPTALAFSPPHAKSGRH